jgi:transcriptional regulator with XRE-family HTH domain
MISCTSLKAKSMARWKPADHRFYRELGYRIKAARMRASLTQAQLAEMVGLTRISIIEVESGQQKILVSNLARIARATQVPLSELVEFADQLKEFS